MKKNELHSNIHHLLFLDEGCKVTGCLKLLPPWFLHQDGLHLSTLTSSISYFTLVTLFLQGISSQQEKNQDNSCDQILEKNNLRGGGKIPFGSCFWTLQLMVAWSSCAWVKLDGGRSVWERLFLTTWWTGSSEKVLRKETTQDPPSKDRDLQIDPVSYLSPNFL